MRMLVLELVRKLVRLLVLVLVLVLGSLPTNFLLLGSDLLLFVLCLALLVS